VVDIGDKNEEACKEQEHGEMYQGGQYFNSPGKMQLVNLSTPSEKNARIRALLSGLHRGG
jgi:hypothetical protein